MDSDIYVLRNKNLIQNKVLVKFDLFKNVLTRVCAPL